jgi:hypothetical protein
MSAMVEFPPTAMSDLLDWAEVNAPDSPVGMLILLHNIFELADFDHTRWSASSCATAYHRPYIRTLPKYRWMVR